MSDMDDVSGRSPNGDGLLPTVEPVPVSPLRAAIPSADALAHLMDDWATLPATYFHERYPFFAAMRSRVMEDYGFNNKEMTSATALVFVEIAQTIIASAIEARRTEARSGSVADESATRQGDAQ